MKIKRHKFFYPLRDYMPYYWEGKITIEHLKVKIFWQNFVRLKHVNYISITHIETGKALIKSDLHILQDLLK